ncbi:MAG: biotin--[acetyl-CoA-carboxylase] ligase [Aerococcaceae bacterium]|nr:biotin--[acetyl-CoA-carboxylase] ligase [Aerococcaceae bacterium]
MSVKTQLLNLFLANKEAVLSGAALAKTLGVSRNAIWKAIEELRQAGYTIETRGRKGYRLVQASFQLDAQQIKQGLSDFWDGLHIEIHDTVTSTNELAKQFLSKHPQQRALFVANAQSQGRGRRGRTFYSDLTDGLYITLAFPLQHIALQEIPQYTLVAASAIAQAFDVPLEIKWINDLFYQGKKVCGILCEAITDLETQEVSAFIVGIGLNLAGSFSQADAAIQEVAGTIFGEKLPDTFNRNELLCRFLEQFATYHQELKARTYLDFYKTRLLGLGKRVTYHIQQIEYEGVIEGINQDGHLLVRDANGQLHTLFGHEIHFSSKQFIQ